MIRDQHQLQERIDGFLGRKQAQYPEIAKAKRGGRFMPKARIPHSDPQPMPAVTTR